ncbi:MAG: hypothetical protein GX100_12225 [candidate division WS1 bacterium]|jgi:predicted  nucleic acid-binding Zn-ribbon protein|nr:hypothetical protein [candidate division WS1 bacterium]
MPLKDDLAQLYQLQQLDSALARVQTELAGLDDGRPAARRAHAAKAAAEQATQALREAEALLKDRELALAGTETERQSKADRAFSGTVTDSKELAALERKLEELDRHRGVLEEEILQLYERVDQLREADSAAQQQASKLAQRARQARAQYQTRSAELQAELQKLTPQREALAAQIPAPLLSQYDQLRARNQGVAVAAVVDGACEFCRTMTPNELATLARHGTQLVRCESCACILVAQ